MSEWIKSKGESSVQELTSQDELESFKSDKLSVLMVTSKSEESVVQKFQSLALNYEDIPFAYTFDEDIKKSLDITNLYGFVVFRNFDDGNKFLVLDELKDMTGFKQFLEAVRYPVVMEFDQQSAERIFGAQKSAMIYFNDLADEGLQTFKEFAKNNTNKILFSHSSITQDLGARLSEFIGITAEDKGQVRIIKFNEGNLDKFRVDDVTAEGL